MPLGATDTFVSSAGRLKRAAMLACGLAVLAGPLAGCAGTMDTVTGSTGLFSSAQAAQARTVQIFVASTRKSNKEGGTGETSRNARFSITSVSIPPGHEPGAIERPSITPESRSRHFVVVGERRIEPESFQQQVAAQVSGRIGVSRDVLVFVHGFNTSYDEARFRLAQIVADGNFTGVPVLFTWPSRGELLAYPYDRESAYYSRDFLEANLRAITRDLGPPRMDILAHSMGTLLTLETLRQAAIRGDGSFGGKLRDVMLAAPDVDLDVFKTQMRQIKRPVTVFVSADDRALDFSRRFAGDKKRLGAVSSKDTETIAELEKLGARLIDLSEVSSGDPLNHAKFAASPKVVQMIGERLRQDKGIGFTGPQLGDKIGDIAGGVVGTVGSTVGLVVTAPAAIAGGVR